MEMRSLFLAGVPCDLNALNAGPMPCFATLFTSISVMFWLTTVLRRRLLLLSPDGCKDSVGRYPLESLSLVRFYANAIDAL